MLVTELWEKFYLGDGAYAGVDRETMSVWIYTSNGIQITNQVCLEPEVFEALLGWKKMVDQKYQPKEQS